MRLVLETGKGSPDSNSYIDAGDISLYLPSADLGKWDALGAEGQADSLILASRFIDTAFNWQGRQKTAGQAMGFPRSGVFFSGSELPDDAVPARVRQACVMAVGIVLKRGFDAFRHSGDRDARREGIGPISVEYFEGSDDAGGAKSNYRDINNMLRGLWIDESKSRVETAGVLRR